MPFRPRPMATKIRGPRKRGSSRHMIACVDVDYREAGAIAACVCFQSWSDDTPAPESVIQISDVEPYQSGQFYRRELPCLLAVLKSLSELPQVIVIDGYV